MKHRCRILPLAAAAMGAAFGIAGSGAPELVRYRAESVMPARPDDRAATFGRPTAVAFDAAAVYVADADDREVRVFDKAGRFLRSIGGPGQGPGATGHPSGVASLDGRIYVADKFNRRIQAFRPDGTPDGGFAVRFFPDGLLALEGTGLLVSHLPLGRGGSEKTVHAFDSGGRLLWEAVDSVASRDPVADALRNRIILCADGSGGFFVIHKDTDRRLRRFASDGRPLQAPDAGPEMPRRRVGGVIEGRALQIEGFCWHAAADGGRLYLLAPDYTEERDLGPGHSVFVLSPDGRVRGEIACPDPLVKIAVDGDRMYAVDAEYNLRVYEIHR